MNPRFVCRMRGSRIMALACPSFYIGLSAYTLAIRGRNAVPLLGILTVARGFLGRHELINSCASKGAVGDPC